jgi:hypothetical protein
MQPSESTRRALSVSHALLAVWRGVTQAGEVVVSRELLETVCAHLLGRALQPVYDVLREAGVHPDDVDDVVMVGGSSRLLAVRALWFGSGLGCRDSRNRCKSANTETESHSAARYEIRSREAIASSYPAVWKE